MCAHIPPELVLHYHSPPSPQLQGRFFPEVTAPTQPAQFSAGCGLCMKSCQSAGSTAVTSPWASAYEHPANTATAAARPSEFTLEGTGIKALEKRINLLVVAFASEKR